MNFSLQGIYNWYRDLIRNPKYRWWVVLGTLAYLLNPFDIAPDFIPIIGELDDAVLMTLLVTEVSQLLIERVRARKGDPVAPSVPTPDASNSDQTVDVDAVSVK